MGAVADEYPYPECEKMADVAHISQEIGLFIDWLLQQGYHIGREHAHSDLSGPVGCMWPEAVGDNWITKRLAEYYDIDLDRVEAERQAMLESLRELQRG